LSRTFPATPGQVGEARRFLASQLDGSPLTADALVCLSELATNAVLHSRSARPGGQFTVRISSAPGSMRVQVIDGGGLWAPGPDGDDHGHGLMIVAALATRLQISDRGTDSPARTVTFEMSLRSPTPI
jgi:anti-sigma regulatory factor (Ser/Thr protein kinase)